MTLNQRIIEILEKKNYIASPDGSGSVLVDLTKPNLINEQMANEILKEIEKENKAEQEVLDEIRELKFEYKVYKKNGLIKVTKNPFEIIERVKSWQTKLKQEHKP